LSVTLLLVAQRLNKLLAWNRLAIVVFVVSGAKTKAIDENVRISSDSRNGASNVLGAK
jgi:hypothetical protein